MDLARKADQSAIREADAAPVIAAVDGAWGRLTLNRPRALHALNLDMCEIMLAALLAWRDDPAIEAVLIDHAGERGFCAGGDVRRLAEDRGGERARAFFLAEYRLNHLLFVYPKPVVAVMDGVTMGGGVGISAPARYRVATERLIYAMPETRIGLFPDVGGGWFLPRLPGESGVWLGLTSAQLKAADCLSLGVATHYVGSGALDELKAALIADPREIETVLTSFGADPGPPPLAQAQPLIDRLFAEPSVEAIIEALTADGSDWARAQLEVLAARSPLSMKVTLRQLRQGRHVASFAEEMLIEHRLVVRVSALDDFREGVRAALVDKDNRPQWRPASLEAVDEALLDSLFAPLPPQEEWTPSP